MRRIIVCLCLAAALLPAAPVAWGASRPAGGGVALQDSGMWPVLPPAAAPPAPDHYVSWPVPEQAPRATSVPAATGSGVSAVALIAGAAALMVFAATFSSGVIVGRRRARMA